MTKSSDNDNDMAEANKAAARLRSYAIVLGKSVAVDFLKRLTLDIESSRHYQQVKPFIREKEISDELALMYSGMVNNFIISLLHTVQETQQLIAATGFLSQEGIPWNQERFSPSEVFDEVERILREADEHHEPVRDV